MRLKQIVLIAFILGITKIMAQIKDSEIKPEENLEFIYINNPIGDIKLIFAPSKDGMSSNQKVIKNVVIALNERKVIRNHKNHLHFSFN